jgi:hypothetical protein
LGSRPQLALTLFASFGSAFNDREGPSSLGRAVTASSPRSRDRSARGSVVGAIRLGDGRSLDALTACLFGEQRDHGRRVGVVRGDLESNQISVPRNLERKKAATGGLLRGHRPQGHLGGRIEPEPHSILFGVGLSPELAQVRPFVELGAGILGPKGARQLWLGFHELHDTTSVSL